MTTRTKYMKLKLSFERNMRRISGKEPERDVEGVSRDVLRYIKHAGQRGLNEQEIYDKCKRFRWMTRSDRRSVMEALLNSEEIKQTQRPRGTKNIRGPLRAVWIATDGSAQFENNQ